MAATGFAYRERIAQRVERLPNRNAVPLLVIDQSDIDIVGIGIAVGHTVALFSKESKLGLVRTVIDIDVTGDFHRPQLNWTFKCEFWVAVDHLCWI